MCPPAPEPLCPHSLRHDAWDAARVSSCCQGSCMCLGVPPRACVPFLGMGGHGNQSDGDGCHSEQQLLAAQPGQGGGGWIPPPPHTHPAWPCSTWSRTGVMSLAGLMPPGGIHPSGSSTRDEASGRSLQPPPAGEGDGLGGRGRGSVIVPPQPLCLLRCWAPHCSTQPQAHVTLHFRAKSCPASGEEAPACCLTLCSSGTSGGHRHTHPHSHANPPAPTPTQALLMPRPWALLQPGGSVSPSRRGNQSREEGVRMGEMWG